MFRLSLKTQIKSQPLKIPIIFKRFACRLSNFNSKEVEIKNNSCIITHPSQINYIKENIQENKISHLTFDKMPDLYAFDAPIFKNCFLLNIMHNNNKNFIYYWLNPCLFPNLKVLYLNKHEGFLSSYLPCKSPEVEMNQPLVFKDLTIVTKKDSRVYHKFKYAKEVYDFNFCVLVNDH